MSVDYITVLTINLIMIHMLLDEEELKYKCKYRKKSKNTNNLWSFITLFGVSYFFASILTSCSRCSGVKLSTKLSSFDSSEVPKIFVIASSSTLVSN